jgi:hypothetical protein
VWLQGKPREVAIALAARAALRVLPIMQTTAEQDYAGYFGLSEALMVFRANYTAWAVVKYPVRSTQDAAIRSHADFGSATSSDPFNPDAAGENATFAAFFAGLVATADDALHVRVVRVFEAAADAFTIAGVPPAALWSAVSIDATRAEEGAASSDIAASPLWFQALPDRLRTLWLNMKAALLATGEDWDVWTERYEARLRGTRSNQKLEVARATIPDKIWKEGPAKVNAEIKRLNRAGDPPALPGRQQ